MKSKTKKVLLGILGGLLAIILIAVMILGWHFPRYLSRKEAFTMTPKEGTITMMSCNVRCLTPLDLGKRSWFYRADLLVDHIVAQAPGIIGFQEATQWQYQYLVDVFTGYDSVIDYRDNSVASEGCPIFYNTSLYSIKEKGSFWLSETPEKMSKDWGAAHYRICSYVILTDLDSGKDFVVFNTHLDHVSDEARIKGIAVVLDKIAQFGDLPAVIMGDFNAEEDSETYTSAIRYFLDAQYAAAETMEGYTYQNWGNEAKFKRLDYFMISQTGWNPLRYTIVQPITGGKYVTDHCPIVLELTLT